MNKALLEPHLARPGEVYYTDLVVGPDGTGVPWKENGIGLKEGLDCKSLAYVILRRAGLAVPGHALILELAWDEGHAQELWDRYLAETERLWGNLGTDARLATRLGDIVVTRSAVGPHLTTVVSESPLLAATICRGTTVQVIRPGLLREVQAVLRFRR